ncbi:MAG: Flp family type IVb pilin [Alphaproteobacteria bacterium]|nr:Flp family type IVb pilin [Alphaproteobacteria bacterium]
MRLLHKYLRSEEGATVVEYALLAAGVALSIVLIVFTLGDQILAIFEYLLSSMTQANDIVQNNS